MELCSAIRMDVLDVFCLIMSRVYNWICAIYDGFPYSFVNLIASSKELKIRSKKQDSRPAIDWSPPPLNWLKWNVDGSSLGKPGPAGIGGVLRNESGFVLRMFSSYVGEMDSNFAEVVAIRRALELTAQAPNYKSCAFIIEYDSLNAIKWVLSPKQRPWEMQVELRKIEDFKKQIDQVNFRHTHREANAFADTLNKVFTKILSFWDGCDV